MVIDEPLADTASEWVKKAIWQARNDNEKGIEILSAMIAEHDEFRKDLAAVLLRSAVRQMIWDNKPMG